jgi:hypothetical protein
MLQISIRFCKRLAVFLPGIIIAYVSWKYTLPFFDKRLPDIVAILATYALAAYTFIPAIIRIWRILSPPNHLPLYCVTPDGFASDPLNFGIVGTRREVIKAMAQTGWYLSDPKTVTNMIKQIASVIFGQSYLNSPVSNLYLFGRKQDIAFCMPRYKSNFSRHHIRFWATTFEGNTLSAHSIHWHDRKTHVQGDKLLWVGAASLDIGLMPIRHNLQITHMVHPDTNLEREFILQGLRTTNLIKKIEQVKLDDPYRLINRAWRSELHTDGIMAVATLKKPGSPITKIKS